MDNMTLVSLYVFQALQLTDPFLLVLSLFLILTLFFEASWAQFHKGAMKTNVHVAELNLLSMIILCLTGLFGSELWNISLTQVGSINLTLRNICILVYDIIALIGCRGLVSETIENIGDKSALLHQWIPVAKLLIAVWIWTQADIFVTEMAISMLIFGIIYSDIASKLLVSYLTGGPARLVSIEATLMLIAGAILMLFEAEHLQYYVLWGLFISILVSIMYWTYDCCNCMAEHLGIYFFSLEKRQTVHAKLHY